MVAAGRRIYADAGVDLAAILRSEVVSAPMRRCASTVSTADAWLLVGCYGIFGFGYIIPATFLPSLARQLLADPAVFGWTWPVFGIAAAVSTVAASLMLRNAAPRRVWALCQ